MATLALGSGAGRLISIATIPVVTRIYGPEDFGVLSVFTAVVLILAPLATLRYVLALPLPRHDGLAMNLLALVLCLLVGIGSLLAFALWFLGEVLFGLLSMEVLAPWWWLIVLGVLGTAAYEALTLWATRKRAYKVMAQTQVTQSVAGAGVKIALGLAGLQPLGLLIGQVVAQAGGTVRLWRSCLSDFRPGWRHVRIARMRMIARRHKSFPIWRVPSQLLMTFSMQAPVLFMANLYDATTTGQFGLAVMALSIPISVLGQAAGNALYGEAAQLMQTDRRKILGVATNIQKNLFLMAVPPAVILFFLGDVIFGLLFGREWVEAGRFASVLSVALVLQFTSAPLIQLMNLLRDQSAFLVVNVIRFVGVLFVFQLSGHFSFEASQTVAAYAMFSASFYLMVSLFVLLALRREGVGHANAKH